MTPEFVLMFGGPGAGKGTQAELLSRALGSLHVSSGDLLRARHAAADAELMQRGKLVPDDLASDIVLARLAQPDAVGGVVLDGYPRTIEQARSLDAWLAGQGKRVSAAIYLEVPEDELIRRTVSRGRSSGRSDDRASVATERLRIFHCELPPVLEHYDERGVLRTIDGALSIEAVHQRVMEAVSSASGSVSGAAFSGESAAGPPPRRCRPRRR